jgi:O-6-methylguanine DNA methyltransferase
MLTRLGKLKMYYRYISTPAGNLLCTSDGQAITGLHWQVFRRAPIVQPSWIEQANLFEGVKAQLAEYFAGTRQQFNFAYHLTGTPFQQKVWQELAKIPYGTATSYKTIAATVGSPKAVRAVGTAVGSNPLSIVMPCHRVLTSTAQLGGYAGGLEAKQALLKLEGITFRR